MQEWHKHYNTNGVTTTIHHSPVIVPPVSQALEYKVLQLTSINANTNLQTLASGILNTQHFDHQHERQGWDNSWL